MIPEASKGRGANWAGERTGQGIDWMKNKPLTYF